MCIQQFIDWFNNDFLYLFEEKQENIIMVETPIIVVDKQLDKQLDKHIDKFNLDEWDIL